MSAKKAPTGNAEHETNRRDMFDEEVTEEGMDTQELLVELARLRASHKVIASVFRTVAAPARSSQATWGRKRGSVRWRVFVRIRFTAGVVHQRHSGSGKVGSDRKDSIGVITPLHSISDPSVSTAVSDCGSLTGVWRGMPDELWQLPHACPMHPSADMDESQPSMARSISVAQHTVALAIAPTAPGFSNAPA